MKKKKSNVKKKETKKGKTNKPSPPPMPEILKFFCTLKGFTWRETSQEWRVTFGIPTGELEKAQKLQDHMNDPFVIFAVQPKTKEEADQVIGSESLEDLQIDMSELNGKK